MSSSSLNVDQRIVQMEFDNAQFEQGVTTTMGTLDKLKNSLNFTGQVNALDGVSKSINSFSAAPIVSAMETAKGKFTALEVAAITAISNITTRIQMMGERLVKAITIDPLKSGWSEYEEKMDSIKTILNSAKDKNGMAVSLDQVKKKIEELNVYADKTIYSFSDMTNNIGKFTNAGVDLDTAVAAIQGVSNAAAAAGADSNAASRAMYNFAQSLSTGFVQRIDWKSIENANMATVEFKEELLKTAIELGTVKQEADGTYMALTQGSKTMKESATSAAMFTENLSTQWLSNDVLIKTLNRYSDATTEIGKKAQEAATRVFTFSKMIDTLGESLQSGWSATWEKIVGDYEQAGELFTGINNYISGIFDASANKRVAFLDKLLNNLGSVKKKDWMAFEGAQKNKKDLETYIGVVKKVAKEHNIDIDRMIEDHKSFENTLKEGWFTKDIMDDVNKYIDGLSAAKKAGKSIYTKDQVKYLKSLTKVLKEGKVSASAYGDLVAHAGKTGRELILDSFVSLFKQLENVFRRIRKAYDEIFPKASVWKVYNALKAFHEFATNFRVTNDALRAFKATFKGIFALFDIFKMAISAVGRGVFTIIKSLTQFGGSILDTTASMGSAITAFHDWLKESKFFDSVVGNIVNVVLTLVEAVKALHIVDMIKNSIMIIAGVLGRVVILAFSLVNAILSSKAFGTIMNIVITIFLKFLYILGNVVPWTVAFVKSLAGLPAVSSALKAVQNFFKTIASLAYGGVLKVLTKIREFIDYVSSSEGLTYIGDVLVGAIVSIINHVSSGIAKIKQFVKELMQLEGVQKVVNNIKEFFGNFKENIKAIGTSGIEQIKQFFNFIGSKLPDSEKVLTTINGLLDGSIDKGQFIKSVFESIKKTITGIVSAIKTFATTKLGIFGNDDVGAEAGKQGGILSGAGETLKTSMEIFANKVREGFAFLSSGKLFSIAAWASTIFIFVQMGRAVGFLGKMVRGFTIGGNNPLTKFIKSLTNSFNASAQLTKANAFETLAKGIGIIALSMIALCSLDTDKLTQVAAVLIGVLLALRVVINGIAKIFDTKVDADSNPLEEALSTLAETFKNSLKKAMKLISIGATMMAIAGGIFLLAVALKNVYEILTSKDFDGQAFLIAGVLLVGFLAALLAAMKAIQMMKIESTIGVASTIVAFGVAIWILVDALKAIPTDKGLIARLFGLVVTMGILLGSLKLLSMIGKDGPTLTALAGSMILLAVAVNLLAIPLAVLSLIPPKRILAVGASLLLLTAGLSALLLVTKLAGGDTAKNLLGVSIAMLVLSKALGSLAVVPTGNLIAAGIAMGIITAALIAFGFVANMIAPGLAVLGRALLGFGIAAAGFGVAAYLIVTAIGMLGPALDSLITGLISFSEKLTQNGPILVAGLVSLITIVCTALLAKRALLSKTAFSVFMSLFTGSQTAILSFLPKSKALIIALVFGLLGVLDTILPGAVSKIVGIIARGIDALAKAIVTKSGPLVGAVFHLIGALGILVLEIFQQMMEGVRGAIKSLTGIDIETILPDVFSIEGARDRIENMKTDLTASINENSEAISKSYDDNADKINESSKNWSSAVSVDDANQEKINLRQGGVASPEESYQSGYASGAAGVQGTVDGANDKASSLNFDFINSLFDKDGMLNTSKMTGLEVGDIFGKGFTSADLKGVMNGESSEMFNALESNLGGDKLGQLTNWASKEMEGNFDLSGIEKKADETAEHVKKKNKEMADSTPQVENKEEKVVQKKNVKMETKVDNSSSKATMKKDAEETANTWQKAFSKKGTSIKNTITNTLKSAAKGAGANSVYTEFRSSAIDSANGILSGLESKMGALYSKGQAMGRKVNEGYRSTKSQDISSPSKVMYKNALFSVQGLLNGFSDNEKNLFKAGEDMGGSINSGTKSALAQVSAMLSSDIDSTPTIRPVLDLSDVARGAGQINGMLNGRTLSVNAMNANMLSASMNARQNRTDPVLSAINNLANNLTNQPPANVYNLNGITYDDGSNIATAIGMLTRAAIVEGRA